MIDSGRQFVLNRFHPESFTFISEQLSAYFPADQCDPHSCGVTEGPTVIYFATAEANHQPAEEVTKLQFAVTSKLGEGVIVKETQFNGYRCTICAGLRSFYCPRLGGHSL